MIENGGRGGGGGGCCLFISHLGNYKVPGSRRAQGINFAIIAKFMTCISIFPVK